MIGFAHAVPHLMMAFTKRSIIKPFLVENDSPDVVRATAAFCAETIEPTRRKALFCVGVRAVAAIEKAGLGDDVIIAVFDTATNLVKDPRIQIIDATGPSYAMTTGALDVDKVFDNAYLGYVPKKQDPMSLSAIFDPMLKNCEDHDQRHKIAYWVGARIIGAMSKKDWINALTHADAYGVRPNLVMTGMRIISSTGKLASLRQAVDMIGAGKSFDEAAREVGVLVTDIKWLDTACPLSEIIDTKGSKQAHQNP